jgi:hypothetical protein
MGVNFGWQEYSGEKQRNKQTKKKTIEQKPLIQYMQKR